MNEEALAHWGLLCQKNGIFGKETITVQYCQQFKHNSHFPFANNYFFSGAQLPLFMFLDHT